MLSLSLGEYQGVIVCPRWPSSQVNIEEDVLARLVEVSKKLPDNVSLILTRGYEPARSGLGMLRRVARLTGIRLFRTLYRHRSSEIADIFGSNGHDVDGTHVDVSFAIDGKRIRFLRLGVFTPSRWQEARVRRYQPYVQVVKRSLVECGFRIHRNHTESLQIHCDYMG